MTASTEKGPPLGLDECAELARMYQVRSGCPNELVEKWAIGRGWGHCTLLELYHYCLTKLSAAGWAWRGQEIVPPHGKEAP